MKILLFSSLALLALTLGSCSKSCHNTPFASFDQPGAFLPGETKVIDVSSKKGDLADVVPGEDFPHEYWELIYSGGNSFSLKAIEYHKIDDTFEIKIQSQSNHWCGVPVRLTLVSPFDETVMETGEYSQAVPQPLEAIGGFVPVTINHTFPPNWFHPAAELTLTPVLRYSGGETKGTAYTYQGEEAAGSNQVVSYASGANVTLRSSFGYIPQMAKSELYLLMEAAINGVTFPLCEYKIGDGVLK